MEFKGTKGIWKITTQEENELFGGEDNYQQIRSGVEYYDKNEPQNGFDLTGFISKENILLISKAPEILEMLKRIMKTYDKGTQTYLDCQQLIKEATELN